MAFEFPDDWLAEEEPAAARQPDVEEEELAAAREPDVEEVASDGGGGGAGGGTGTPEEAGEDDLDLEALEAAACAQWAAAAAAAAAAAQARAAPAEGQVAAARAPSPAVAVAGAPEPRPFGDAEAPAAASPPPAWRPGPGALAPPDGPRSDGPGPRPSAGAASAGAVGVPASRTPPARGAVGGRQAPVPADPSAEPPAEQEESTRPAPWRGAAPWRAQAAAQASGGNGAKRPRLDSDPGPEPPRPASGAAAGRGTIKAKDKEKLVLPKEVVLKLHALKQEGVVIFAPAVRALSEADKHDALVVLQALAKRAHVDNPTQWVVASLQKKGPCRKEAPAAGAAKQPQNRVPKAPGATPPAARLASAATASGTTSSAAAAAVASAARVAKAPGAKAAVAKVPGARALAAGAQRPGVGKPPQLREGLEFDSMAVQAKLLALSKLNIWPGSHPLDDAALCALLEIAPGRALEILDEAEDKGAELKHPSSFVCRLASEEKHKYANSV